MKNLKKIAVVLAAMTLSLSALTACGSNDPTESTPSNDAAAVESSASAEADSDPTAALSGTFWVGKFEGEDDIVGMAFYEDGTGKGFELEEDAVTETGSGKWTVDEDTLYVDDDSMHWEMPDKKTLVLSDEEDTITLSAVEGSTEEEFIAAMKACAADAAAAESSASAEADSDPTALSGTLWVGKDEGDNVGGLALYEDGTAKFYGLEEDAVTETDAGKWSADEETLYFTSGGYGCMHWEMPDKKTLVLREVLDDEEIITLSAVEGSTEEELIAAMKAYAAAE